MACAAILNSWTFCTLVGAYLDLGLAYFLLCCSALAFFASKFLALFGLSLPCPCNGLFGDPNFICLQRLLVDAPTGMIASVHGSVRQSFPFDCIWAGEGQFNLKLLRDRPSTEPTALLEMDGEGSCSSRSLTVSRSERRRERPPQCAQFANSTRSRGGFDVKGKGVLSQRPLSRRRNRRRASFDKRGVSTGSSSSGHLQLIGEDKQDVREESSANSDSEGIGSVEATLSNIESDGQLGEYKVTEKDAYFVKELVRNARGCGLDGSEAGTIQILEQALEEEHAARTALYMELEKERNAAATAADEAMAMILRLQEEKASIEMEARQYQRLIEEKSAYDEEEMNILTEILVRREREVHFLENEVEAYRQMMLSSERNPKSENDPLDMSHESRGVRCASFGSADDPILMLQQISESIRIKELKNDVNRFSEDGPSAKIQSGPLVLGKDFLSCKTRQSVGFLREEDAQSIKDIESRFPYKPECMDRYNVEFQEKGMVSTDEHPSTLQGEGTQLKEESPVCKLNGPQEYSLHEKTSCFANEKHEQEDKVRICHEAAETSQRNHSEIEVRFMQGAGEQDNHIKNSGRRCSGDRTSLSEMELGVHDVHVIDDKSKRCSEGCRKENEMLLLSTASKSLNKAGFPSEYTDNRMNSVEAETNIRRSISDIPVRFRQGDSSQNKVSSGLHCNSISSVENERLKLETEVGRLRERLKVVQDGREKLTFAVDHRERERFQLQLLEEIANQLHEIRLLTRPGISTRQTSLPPPSSKVNSKKRRCRSVSHGLQEST